MDREKLESLLDCIYELEGLVHLTLSREDMPDRIIALIGRKGIELSRLAEGLSGNPVRDAVAEEPVAIESSEQRDAVAEDDASETVALESDGSEDNAKEESTPQETVSKEKNREDGDLRETIQENMPETEQEEEPLYVVDIPEDDEMPIEDDMQSVVEEMLESIPESDDTPSAPEVESETAEAQPHSPRGRLVFSINDRYRFRKELFGGSDAGFNNTLALVASMEDYDEAEDYFLGELQWDQKQRDVVDFLDILKRYFK